MNARAGLSSYLPRFALAIVAVPVAFVAAAFAATGFGAGAERVAALAGALTFALVVLAPSTRNAAVRAGLACAVTVLLATIALAAR